MSLPTDQSADHQQLSQLASQLTQFINSQPQQSGATASFDQTWNSNELIYSHPPPPPPPPAWSANDYEPSNAFMVQSGGDLVAHFQSLLTQQPTAAVSPFQGSAVAAIGAGNVHGASQQQLSASSNLNGILSQGIDMDQIYASPTMSRSIEDVFEGIDLIGSTSSSELSRQTKYSDVLKRTSVGNAPPRPGSPKATRTQFPATFVTVSNEAQGQTAQAPKKRVIGVVSPQPTSSGVDSSTGGNTSGSTSAGVLRKSSGNSGGGKGGKMEQMHQMVVNELPESVRRRGATIFSDIDHVMNNSSESDHDDKQDDVDDISEVKRRGLKNASSAVSSKKKSRRNKSRATGRSFGELAVQLLLLILEPIGAAFSLVYRAVKFTIGSIFSTIWIIGVAIGAVFLGLYNSTLRLVTKLSPFHGGKPQYGLIRNARIRNVTADDLILRILSGNCSDAYSVLGLRFECGFSLISRYYSEQVSILESSKSTMGWSGCIELLNVAYSVLGTEEKRKTYDVRIGDCGEFHGELRRLQHTLRQQFSTADDWLPCDECGGFHRRVTTNRARRDARFCYDCYLSHPARDGDLWAESYSFCHFLRYFWTYYACMEGVVYDVTEWARCQQNRLKHLKANTHQVVYIVPTNPAEFGTNFGCPRPTTAKVAEIQISKQGGTKKSRRIKRR